VAGYAVAGVPEVVLNEKTGLLVSPSDLAGLGICAVRLLKDTHARRGMGEAARDRCRTRFDIAAIAPRYLELYQQLAAAS
jgi:glycosyltransferase involved in cell wall biosynthesis